jgi:mevalonate kinase
MVHAPHLKIIKPIPTFKVSVPGSLMLFGEHAVLHGKHALACAINKRINLELRKRNDELIKINSNTFGEINTSLFDLTTGGKPSAFELILAAIQQKLPKLNTGFELSITSELEPAIGFGSSTAITIGVTAILEHLLTNRTPDPLKLLLESRNIIRQVQATGSGTDAAASIFGSIVFYCMSPLSIIKLARYPELSVVYSGKKRATREVVDQVNHLHNKYIDIFMHLYDAIDNCSIYAKDAIESQNWQTLGELMNIQQGLQESLGVNNANLAEIIWQLHQQPKVLGAKISGAGLGDCVIALGKISPNTFPINTEQKKLGIKQFDIAISKEGIIYG